jgi:hypothetical protein
MLIIYDVTELSRRISAIIRVRSAECGVSTLYFRLSCIQYGLHSAISLIHAAYLL